MHNACVIMANQMPPEIAHEENKCAYCQKPAGNGFVCEQCIVDHKISLESVPVFTPEKESVAHAITELSKPDSQGVLKSSVAAEDVHTPSIPGKEPWANIKPHSDFNVGTAHYASLALAGAAIVGGVVWDFYDRVVLNIGDGWQPILMVALGVSWIFYKLTRGSWSHYATWVYTKGKKMECVVDMVPSGEIERPFLMLSESGVLSSLYTTRVFSIQQGDPAAIGYDPRHPNKSWSFTAVASYDPHTRGNAVIFEIDGHRMWCRAVPKKIS